MRLCNNSTKMLLRILTILCVLGTGSSLLTPQQKKKCINYQQESEHDCSPGTHRCDRGCCVCEEGTYMTEYNTCSECIPFTECENGQEVLFNGNYQNNRVCGEFIDSSSVHPTVYGHSEPPNGLSVAGMNTPPIGHMTTSPPPPDMAGPACPLVPSWAVALMVVCMITTVGSLYYACRCRSRDQSLNASRMLCDGSSGSSEGLEDFDNLGSSGEQLDLEKELDSVKVT